MLKVSNEELSKISQFIAGCNDMINGKFILADIKISKVLNMLAQSSELYNFIKDCMTDFDFSREYHRAEVKNRLNNGAFAVPSQTNSLVAFVFCLLVECDAKRIDFYNFINENFPSANKADSYKQFANKLLVPFRDAISMYFNFDNGSQENLSVLTENYKQDLMAEPVFDNYATEQPNQNYNNQNLQDINYQYDNYNQQQNVAPQNLQPQVEVKTEEPKNDIWAEIKNICETIMNSVYTERKIKPYLREELIYILKTIKYSTKYKDAKIISALATAFDEMSKKYRSVQFVFDELKNKIEELY